ncbi:MAG: SH3 domain-containing protein [Spirochaetaceae bacterium]|jgi:hypothetical protein|nr:SH3 domain-containing protein [Spirochaetaceae bacterium]
MKDRHIFFYMGLIALVLVSCSKPDASVISQAAASSSQPAAGAFLSEGMALRVNSSFCVAVTDDEGELTGVKWSDSLILGERVFILGESAKYTYAGDKAEYDFTPVRRENGREGFMFSSQLAPAGDLAVVVEERAVLYREPRNTDALSTILPVKTVIVTYPETGRDGFVQFQAYDAERQRYYRESFIKTQPLSFAYADVQSVILLHTASVLGSSETIRKEALLDAAYNDYPGSVFAAEIRELLSGGKDVRASLLSSLWINDHDVNVRDMPDENRGKIITQLSLDTEVSISEETIETYTVNGQSARWYHITSPVEGWVFGAFLGK